MDTVFMAKQLLTDAAVRNAKPRDKAFKLSDGAGLYLLVRPNGTKAWRFDYRFANKRKTLAVGLYPAVKLSKDREYVVRAKGELHSNLDPSLEKQRREREEASAHQSNLFPDVAREWWEHNHKTWKPDHASRVWTRLVNDAIPELKGTP